MLKLENLCVVAKNKWLYYGRGPSHNYAMQKYMSGQNVGEDTFRQIIPLIPKHGPVCVCVCVCMCTPYSSFWGGGEVAGEADIRLAGVKVAKGEMRE